MHSLLLGSFWEHFKETLFLCTTQVHFQIGNNLGSPSMLPTADESLAFTEMLETPIFQYSILIHAYKTLGSF